MAHQAEDTDQILEAAFDKAFSPPPSRRQSMQPPAKAPADTESALDDTTTAPQEPSAASTEESWKVEYEEHVKAWRAQSAEAREKAEKVREQWEVRRAAEREQFAGTSREPEVISGPGHAPMSQAEVQNKGGKEDVKAEEKARYTIVEGLSGPTNHAPEGPQRHAGGSTSSTLARLGSQPDTIDGSQKWEEVNSPTSSYPSMSFPEQTATPPSHPHLPPQAPPQSVTLSVFDSSLSTRTRLKALASSLAINLVLPFVNGVMLGFGEIFAKNFILGWLGWGSTATTVGITQRQRFGQPGQPGFR